MVDDGGAHGVAAGLAVPVAQVSLAIRLGGEGVLAVAALVRPLAVVRAHMPNEGALVVARDRAHVTPIRSVSQMVPVVT